MSFFTLPKALIVAASAIAFGGLAPGAGIGVLGTAKNSLSKALIGLVIVHP